MNVRLPVTLEERVVTICIFCFSAEAERSSLRVCAYTSLVVYTCAFHLLSTFPSPSSLNPFFCCLFALAPFPVAVNAFNGRSFTVWTRTNEVIADIKLKLAMQEGVPAEQQRLVFQGRDLEEMQTVAASGVVQHSTLHLVFRHAPPAGRVTVQLVAEAAHSTLSIQRLSLCAPGGCDALLSSLQASTRR